MVDGPSPWSWLCSCRSCGDNEDDDQVVVEHVYGVGETPGIHSDTDNTQTASGDQSSAQCSDSNGIRNRDYRHRGWTGQRISNSTGSGPRSQIESSAIGAKGMDTLQQTQQAQAVSNEVKTMGLLGARQAMCRSPGHETTSNSLRVGVTICFLFGQDIPDHNHHLTSDSCNRLMLANALS